MKALLLCLMASGLFPLVDEGTSEQDAACCSSSEVQDGNVRHAEIVMYSSSTFECPHCENWWANERHKFVDAGWTVSRQNIVLQPGEAVPSFGVWLAGDHYRVRQYLTTDVLRGLLRPLYADLEPLPRPSLKSGKRAARPLKSAVMQGLGPANDPNCVGGVCTVPQQDPFEGFWEPNWSSLRPQQGAPRLLRQNGSCVTCPQ